MSYFRPIKFYLEDGSAALLDPFMEITRIPRSGILLKWTGDSYSLTDDRIPAWRARPYDTVVIPTFPNLIASRDERCYANSTRVGAFR